MFQPMRGSFRVASVALASCSARPRRRLRIHPSGTFETGKCGAWTAYQGTVQQDGTARTGSGSCRVCTATATTDFFTADDKGSTGPALVGATYRAEGWVRSTPDKPTPGPVRLILRNFTVAGGTFTDLESTRSDPGYVEAPWHSRASTLTITKGGGKLNVVVSGEHRSGACFLLDDVTVQRID
jgi:hypothetical protein